MGPERKVLLIDGLLGASMLLNGGLFFSVAARWWAGFVFAGAAVWIAGLFYWVERTAVEESLRDILGSSIGIASPVLIAIAMGVSNHPLADTVVASVLAGYGLGILGYRFVYGILRPIPERRLDGARGRAV